MEVLREGGGVDALLRKSLAKQGAVEEENQLAAKCLPSKLIYNVARFYRERPILIFLRFRI